LREGQFNNQFMVAYIIADQSLTNGEIRDFLGLSLPSSMIPSAFVTLNKFPLTINGKIDRVVLPELHYQRSKTDKNFTPPTNATEQQRSKLWAELLKLNDIGLNDSFFEWGGDSLLAVELTHRMEAILNIDLPIMYIFENPTINAILENLASVNQRSTASSLEKIQVKGKKRPLFYIGTTNYARSLSTILGDGQPIYGLNIFGVREAVNPNLSVSIEIIAEQFLAEIQKIQPVGPYQIASFCADALIAFEAAQQILKANQSVSLFATIDTVWNEDPEDIIGTAQLLNRSSYFNFSFLMHRLSNNIKKIMTKPYKASSNPEIVAKHQQFLGRLKGAQ
jgi:hypothetical protein